MRGDRSRQAVCSRVVLPGLIPITRRRLLLYAATLGLLGAAACAALPGGGEALAYLLPALLMMVALAARWYPGERTLLRLARGRHARRPTGEGANGPRQPRRALLPRGGRLIASSLAVRPPPPASVFS
jgi:hypothetical protein